MKTPEARIGDTISGTCVTFGSQKTGRVTEVIGPIASPDCGGYRYKLADTGEFYGHGGPVEPVVFYGRHEALAPACKTCEEGCGCETKSSGGCAHFACWAAQGEIANTCPGAAAKMAHLYEYYPEMRPAASRTVTGCAA